MKIPKQFFQFKNKKALIIVAGAQTAKFYLGYDGELSALEELNVIKEKQNEYIDEKKFSADRVKRGLGIAGHLIKEKKDKIEKEFLLKLKDKTKKITAAFKPNAVFVFAPAYILPKIISLIPKSKAPVKSFNGEYIKLPLTKLLAIIKTK